MAWTQEKIEATLQRVLKKAQEDVAFREKLKQCPKQILEEEGGEVIPEHIRLMIVDQNDTDFVITLPKTHGDELSDMDLEGVAGGAKKSQKADCQDAERPGYEHNNSTHFYYQGTTYIVHGFGRPPF